MTTLDDFTVPWRDPSDPSQIHLLQVTNVHAHGNHLDADCTTFCGLRPYVQTTQFVEMDPTCATCLEGQGGDLVETTRRIINAFAPSTRPRVTTGAGV